MKIARFEDIMAWQESRALVKSIYGLIGRSKNFQNDLRFRSQITNAAISVMSNIAEGFARKSNKEFKQFLFIAKGSISEVQSQLYVAWDLGYIKEEEFQKAYAQLDKTARLISGFITYLSKANKLKNPLNPTNSMNPINSTNSSTGGTQ